MRPNNLRSRQGKGWLGFPVENTIDEDAVFAVTDEIEAAILVKNFDVLPGDKRRVAHAHIDIALVRIASDHDPLLRDHVLELSGLQLGDRTLAVRRPLAILVFDNVLVF